jgi:hypothetical protein
MGLTTHLKLKAGKGMLKPLLLLQKSILKDSEENFQDYRKSLPYYFGEPAILLKEIIQHSEECIKLYREVVSFLEQGLQAETPEELGFAFSEADRRMREVKVFNEILRTLAEKLKVYSI